jgi:hypothetical protein
MPAKGYFIITDISGYTEYLTKSELEHAHATLQGLFEAQLARIQFPLHLSGFRGDAIFLYVPETDFINPQSLVETLEIQYIVFSDALRQMRLNTTCPCNACKNMHLLDLKAAVHYGEYLIAPHVEEQRHRKNRHQSLRHLHRGCRGQTGSGRFVPAAHPAHRNL